MSEIALKGIPNIFEDIFIFLFNKFYWLRFKNKNKKCFPWKVRKRKCEKALFSLVVIVIVVVFGLFVCLFVYFFCFVFVCLFVFCLFLCLIFFFFFLAEVLSEHLPNKFRWVMELLNFDGFNINTFWNQYNFWFLHLFINSVLILEIKWWNLCTRQRASRTYPTQVFTSVHFFNCNNWVKSYRRENKVGWRFTKLLLMLFPSSGFTFK